MAGKYELYLWQVVGRVKGKTVKYMVRAKTIERAVERYRIKYPSARRTKNNNILVKLIS